LLISDKTKYFIDRKKKAPKPEETGIGGSKEGNQPLNKGKEG
jgi:hypothetical protein